MKRLILIFLALLVFVGIPSAQADSGWTMRSFDSQIVLEQDGQLSITETIVADFGDIAKHGIFRDIPVRYKADDNNQTIYTQLSDIDVDQDSKNAETKISKSSDYWNIRIGDEDKTITGLHTYKIHYKVLGALRNFNGYDEIAWNVTGNGWQIPIEKVTATVTLPSGEVMQAACYQGPQGSTERCPALFQPKQLTAQFSATREFGASEGLTVSVGYPSGLVPIVTIPRPPTIAEQLFQPGPIMVSIITLLAGIWFVVSKYRQIGRDSAQDSISNTIVAEYEPPAGLRPAELGVLVDEKADTLDVTATIIDLASRGFLTIKEEAKKWLFGTTDYILTKSTAKTDKLLSYEKKLLDALFKDGETVSLSSLKNTFYTELSEVKNSLYETVTTAKLFTSNPDKIRQKYLLQGALLLVVGVGGSIFAFTGIPVIASFTVPLSLVGLMVMMAAPAMPARSAHGRELYRQALGYKLFIDTAEKYRARFAENENLFTEVLPYAIVFGATKKFAKAMKDMGLKPSAPSWYIGAHAFNPVVFASDIDTFSSSLSTAMVSSPSSSGGGGSSGGGFGGGGGGSW